MPQHPILAFTKHLFLIKITCQQWCKVLPGNGEGAPFVGSTTSTGCSASHSLHQPSSEMRRAKTLSWHRPRTKLRVAGYFLFEPQLVLPSLSSPEERILAASHTSQTLREQLPWVGARRGAQDMLVIWYLSVSFDFIFLPRAQALEPKEETSVRVRT